MLLYNGDSDLVCDYLGTQLWSNAVKWPFQSQFLSAPKQAFTARGEQAGTYRKASTLTQLVVNDAGHMVPFDQPMHALELLQQFVNNSL